MQPFLDLRVGDDAGLRRHEILPQERDELIGRDALELVVVEPLAQERVELVPAELRFEERQEQRALFVRHR